MNNSQLKALALITLILSTSPSFAHKIVLLTSLDPEQNRPALRFASWNINEKLEKRFYKEHKKLPAKVSTEVIHFAQAKDLYSALRDPEAVAVIWVGHAGFSNGEGLSSLRSIVDYKGRDLKNIFQAIGPHLKYLGLVGCRGQLFLNEWKEKGFLRHAPKLKTFAREVRTDARKGLKLAMRELKEHLKSDSSFLSTQEENLPLVGEAYQMSNPNQNFITIRRDNFESQDMDSIQILQKDRLIGFLPKSSSDQEITLKLNNGLHNNDFKIISDSGAASSVIKINLGKLAIAGEPDETWEIFKTASGKPIGVGKHIYRYKKP